MICAPYCRPCDLCRMQTRVECLERAEAWPIAWVCPSCREELRVDDEDPRDPPPDFDERDGEPECGCCGGCQLCLAVRGML